jgi:hypothetical protein
MGLCPDGICWLLGFTEFGVVAVFLAVASLGGWVPRIVFLNAVEAIIYGKQCGSEFFVVDHTYEGDN